MTVRSLHQGFGWVATAIALAILAARAPLAAQDEKAKAPQRLFELLEYEARDGKLDALVEQFRKDLTAIEKHGATVLGCWTRPQRGTATAVTSAETSAATSTNGVTTTEEGSSSSSTSSGTTSTNHHKGGALVCLFAFSDKVARDAFWRAVQEDADCVVLDRSKGRALWKDLEAEMFVPTDYSPTR